MPQFAEGLGLNLADALSGNAKLPAHLFKGAAPAILQAEAELKHTPFPVRQRMENVANLLLEQLEGCGVGGGWGALVFNEVSEVAVLLLANGSLE